MKVLIIEDDYLFGTEIRKDLEAAIPQLQGSIRIIKTEKEFRDVFLSATGPDCQLIILDVIVQWEVAGSGSIPDPDAQLEGYLRAGTRCLERIRRHSTTANIPVIIHSARDSEQIRQEIRGKLVSLDNLEIIPKSGAPEPLVEAVKHHIPAEQA